MLTISEHIPVEHSTSEASIIEEYSVVKHLGSGKYGQVKEVGRGHQVGWRSQAEASNKIK